MKRFQAIEIDTGGYLQVARKGRGYMSEQLCPFNSSQHSNANCGDWCPHFGEPYKPVHSRDSQGDNIMATDLDICHGTTLRSESGGPIADLRREIGTTPTGAGGPGGGR